METNLYDETIIVLAANSKSPQDVAWVGSANGAFAISWEEFVTVAKKSNYDSGFGSQEVAHDLVVVGSDWWLERHEYDGAEDWQFKRMPMRQADPAVFNVVLGHGWSGLTGGNWDK